MRLSRREQSMRESLEKRGIHFITPTFELPDISARNLIILSGNVIQGSYDQNTVLAYIQDDKVFVPDVDSLDEKNLNTLLNIF